jgi:large subunit ribosomal protein L3
MTPGLPPPTIGPAAALKRKERTTPVRAGVLAIKKGMTAFMGRTGTRIPCTVLQLSEVQVVANRTFETHGYWGVQVGLGHRRAAALTAPMLGYYEAKGIEPKKSLAEFRVRNETGLLPVGVQLQPDWFHVGQRVDVRSNSRGMGFAGGMKRHGFSGQEKSHGNSLNHRTIGSVGPSQGSGSRVLPGKKMPGRMGNERVTVQNLPILMIDNELGIVVVKGCVAGPKGCVVKIQDALKKPPPPQEFIEKTRKLLEERFPDAEEQLTAARKRHLELKEARREGRIDELLEAGVGALPAQVKLEA